MKLALRGVMDADGDIIAWPMLLMDHKQAFFTLWWLEDDYRARWRQWEPDGPVEFDKGVSDEDKAAVEAYVRDVQHIGAP